MIEALAGTIVLVYLISGLLSAQYLVVFLLVHLTCYSIDCVCGARKFNVKSLLWDGIRLLMKQRLFRFLVTPYELLAFCIITLYRGL